MKKQITYKLKGLKMEHRDFIYIEMDEVENIFIRFTKKENKEDSLLAHIKAFDILVINYINEGF